MQELLAKRAFDPLTDVAKFYFSVFVAPKYLDGLCSFLNLKQFNHYMHIPSFRMPTIKQLWQLIQHGDYVFSIDFKDAYLYVPIVKHQCCFCDLFHRICLISGRFHLLGLL